MDYSKGAKPPKGAGGKRNAPQYPTKGNTAAQLPDVAPGTDPFVNFALNGQPAAMAPPSSSPAPMAVITCRGATLIFYLQARWVCVPREQPRV